MLQPRGLLHNLTPTNLPRENNLATSARLASAKVRLFLVVLYRNRHIIELNELDAFASGQIFGRTTQAIFCRSKRSGLMMMFTMPVSSSRLRNTKPFAVSGR